jgi:hypothetical protein
MSNTTQNKTFSFDWKEVEGGGGMYWTETAPTSSFVEGENVIFPLPACNFAS